MRRMFSRWHNRCCANFFGANRMMKSDDAWRKKWGRWITFVLFAIAGGAATVVTLWFHDRTDVRAIRETVPLAAVLSGLLALLGCRRWPRTLAGGGLMGALLAIVGLVVFSALYLSAEAIIATYVSKRPGDSVADAALRLTQFLPIGTLAATVFFGLAGWLMWALGALGHRGAG
jgi:hypothetical protein